MNKKSLDEEIKIRAAKSRCIARHMCSTENLVEEQIRKAQAAGKFDNLEGAGEPLNLEENPFEPPELRMIFRILKRNNYAPYWIELGNEIDSDLEKFWKEVEHFRKYTKIFFSKKNTEQALKRYEAKKSRFLHERNAVIEHIDKKITDFNLACPTFRLCRHNLNVKQEMEKVVNEIEKE